MNDRKKQEIKFLQQHHFSSDTISKSLEIPVKEICDILGYPKDYDGRVAAHKDYNFYDHGVDHRAEFYSFFLQEGDFEKWQPASYMNKNSIEYNEMLSEARCILETNNPRDEARRYWILMRFANYQKEDFKILRDKFVLNINKVEGILVEKRICFFS